MDAEVLKEARDLMHSMRALCGDERAVLCAFLEGLAAVEGKGLHLQLGFPNMFELCRLEFGLSEGCIYRRLQVARKLKHYPELLQALRSGKLNLTLASLLCPYLGKHAFSALLSCVSGQTKRHAQKALRDLEKLVDNHPSQSRIQYLGREHYSYRLKIPSELHHQWERARELLSHQVPDGDIQTILQLMTSAFLKKNDPQSQVAPSPELWQHYSSPTRYIPKGLKQILLEQADFQCQFQSPEGRRCSQKRYLDIDHIIPLAAGGLTSLENLQVLCHAHNLLKGDNLPSPTPHTNHNHFPILGPGVTVAASPRRTLTAQWLESKKAQN